VLEALFILLEFRSPSRRIFIGSHSLPPIWFAVSVLHLFPKSVRPVSPRQIGKTQPAETTSSSKQSISRFTQGIATNLRGKVDYLLGNLKGSIPKCIQKGGIKSQLLRTPFPEFIQKPPNRSRFGGLVGARSPSKEAQVPHT
jgi:hypothetical protein